jgi:hypothetical protein
VPALAYADVLAQGAFRLHSRRLSLCALVRRASYPVEPQVHTNHKGEQYATKHRMRVVQSQLSQLPGSSDWMFARCNGNDRQVGENVPSLGARRAEPLRSPSTFSIAQRPWTLCGTQRGSEVRTLSVSVNSADTDASVVRGVTDSSHATVDSERWCSVNMRGM